MIYITKKAKEKVMDLSRQQSGKYLRLFIRGIGWSGPRLGVALDEPGQNEKPVVIDGVDILVAEHIRPYVDGARIDYGKRWFRGEGFTVSASELSC